jgi:Tol biopolymer transport system component
MAPNGRAIGVWWNTDGFQSMVWEPLAPPPPAIAGTLIFASSPFGADFELYTMKAVDGSQRTRRVFDTAEDTDPVWSPDSARVCFVSTRNAPEFSPDSTDLYLWEAAGSGQIIRLTWFGDDGGRARDPAWSHDGTRIAFAAGYRQEDDIRVLDVVSMNHFQLTMGGNNRWPTWFRDDSKIAYSGAGDLLMVDPALDSSQTPTVVLSRANTDESPAFSPDGETIAFAARGPLAHGIQTVVLTTGTVVPLTSTEGDRAPGWSPGGGHLAFVRDGMDGARVWIMENDGQDVHEVPGQLGENEDPDWKE